MLNRLNLEATHSLHVKIAKGQKSKGTTLNTTTISTTTPPFLLAESIGVKITSSIFPNFVPLASA